MLTRNLKPQRKLMCESWSSDYKVIKINSYNSSEIKKYKVT